MQLAGSTLLPLFSSLFEPSDAEQWVSTLLKQLMSANMGTKKADEKIRSFFTLKS